MDFDEAVPGLSAGVIAAIVCGTIFGVLCMVCTICWGADRADRVEHLEEHKWEQEEWEEWPAQQPNTDALPAPWQQVPEYSPDGQPTGRFYYYNTQSNEVSWMPPSPAAAADGVPMPVHPVPPKYDDTTSAGLQRTASELVAHEHDVDRLAARDMIDQGVVTVPLQPPGEIEATLRQRSFAPA